MSEEMKSWLPVIVQVLTPIMVLYMSFKLQDKRSHDQELLQEVKNIKTAINRSAVVFGQIEVKIDNLEDRVSKIEVKLEK